MQVYLGEGDGDILEAIKKHALDTDHSLSWATRDLIRLGNRMKVAIETGVLDDLIALARKEAESCS